MLPSERVSNDERSSSPHVNQAVLARNQTGNVHSMLAHITVEVRGAAWLSSGMECKIQGQEAAASPTRVPRPTTHGKGSPKDRSRAPRRSEVEPAPLCNSSPPPPHSPLTPTVLSWIFWPGSCLRLQPCARLLRDPQGGSCPGAAGADRPATPRCGGSKGRWQREAATKLHRVPCQPPTQPPPVSRAQGR